MFQSNNSVDHTQFRKLMWKHFSLLEIRMLCDDLDIQYEDLSGEGRIGIVHALITRVERYGRISELLSLCREQRPNITWPELQSSTPSESDTAFSFDHLSTSRRDARSAHHSTISAMLAQARENPVPLRNQMGVEQSSNGLRWGQAHDVGLSQGIKIDKKIIYGFDLEELKKGLQGLGVAGTFSFSLGGVGDHGILKEFIIKRILLEIRGITLRAHLPPIDLYLYPADLVEGEHAIEAKLASKQGGRGLCDGITRDATSHDMVIIVWNCRIPAKSMVPIAQCFWQETCIQRAMPILLNQARRLVVLWVNVSGAPLDLFTVLPTPTRFEIQPLRTWFRGHFATYGLDSDTIEFYLDRIGSHHGDLLGTYAEMRDIYFELQGGIAYND